MDLDADVQKYLPEFKPHNLWPESLVTLRQLLSHTSGLIREPAVGHYFVSGDADAIEEVVNSLNSSTLCHQPGTGSTKYSNAALTVAGLVVQKIAGMPFRQYVSISSGSFALAHKKLTQSYVIDTREGVIADGHEAHRLCGMGKARGKTFGVHVATRRSSSDACSVVRFGYGTMRMHACGYGGSCYLHAHYHSPREDSFWYVHISLQ